MELLRQHPFRAYPVTTHDQEFLGLVKRTTLLRHLGRCVSLCACVWCVWRRVIQWPWPAPAALTSTHHHPTHEGRVFRAKGLMEELQRLMPLDVHLKKVPPPPPPVAPPRPPSSPPPPLAFGKGKTMDPAAVAAAASSSPSSWHQQQQQQHQRRQSSKAKDGDSGGKFGRSSSTSSLQSLMRGEEGGGWRGRGGKERRRRHVKLEVVVRPPEETQKALEVCVWMCVWAGQGGGDVRLPASAPIHPFIPTSPNTQELLDSTLDIRQANDVSVDPSAFRVSELTPLSDVYVFFDLIRTNRVFVVSYGAFVRRLA